MFLAAVIVVGCDGVRVDLAVAGMMLRVVLKKEQPLGPVQQLEE